MTDFVVHEFDADTLVVALIDRSGSMRGCKAATIEGYNGYKESMKANGGKVRMTTALFDRDATLRLDLLHDAIPLKEVPDLTEAVYVPYGSTPLYDAVGKLVKKTEDVLMRAAGDIAVLFVILTDGEENSSREFSQNDIKALIQAKTEIGWSFVYLGANQDAWAIGTALGVSAGNTKSYATADMRETFTGLAMATRSYFSARSASANAGETNFTSSNFYATDDEEV